MTGPVPVRVPFDEEFLELSYGWLRDPEIARLTRVPGFDREAQRTWWRGLPDRTDYAVWGIAYNGVPVGALGLKDIGVAEGGEYFMYIGDPAYWGCGISAWAFDEIVGVARDLGLRYVYGITGKDNPRALHVNFRHGFRVVEERESDFFLVYEVPDRPGPTSE